MIDKRWVIFIALVAFGAYELNNINVPDTMERPLVMKIIIATNRLIKVIIKILTDLNFGTDHSNTRNILHNAVNLILKKPEDVKVELSKIEGIDVIYYTPLNSVTNKLPIMVFYHGGGYILGIHEMYDLFLADLVKTLNLKIIFVDYKLAPEYAYPGQVNDCYSVAKFVLLNTDKLNGDSDRIIFAGDSAGGNLVAVITQKLQAEKLKQPKIQILIYPWLQMFNHRLPSYMKYSKNGMIESLTLSKYLSWYLGITEYSDEIAELLANNYHVDLLNDKSLKEKFQTYLDVNLIPNKFKIGKSYYEDYESQKNNLFPILREGSELRYNKKLNEKLAHLFTTNISPGLADLNALKDLPKALILVCEMDLFKDENLIYAERLKMAGVDVKTEYYENGFHIAINLSGFQAFDVSTKMINDIIDYLRKNI